MNKRNIKLIMELIFIFILPLGIILASISCEKAMTYDENGNQLNEEKHIEYNNNFLRENDGYLNDLEVYELLPNNTQPYNDYTGWSCDYPGTIELSTENGEQCIKPWITNYNYNNGNNGYLKTGILDYTLDHTYYFSIRYTTQLSSSTPTTSEYYTVMFPFNDYNLVLDNVGGSNITTYEEIIKATTNRNDVQKNLRIRYYNVNSTSSTKKYICIYDIQLVDLTIMFGLGNEPTSISDYHLYTNNEKFNYRQNGEIIKYISSQPISNNYVENTSIWSKIKELLIENLNLKDGNTINIILDYTALWFIMFIIWHLFYLFFDMLVHIFLDWGHKEKEKVK